MSIGPVIDYFPVVMNSVDGRVRDLGSDLRTSGPVDLFAVSFDRLGRDEMGSRGLVTAKKYVQVVVFVGPDDWAVMMIAAPFLAQANRFREAAICWPVSDQHWVGLPVSIFAPAHSRCRPGKAGC